MKDPLTHNTIGKGLSNRSINGGRDDFLTPLSVAKRLVRAALALAPEARVWVEPSAGAGAFLDAAKFYGIEALGFDIAPLREDISKRDWLSEEVVSADVVFGNPPFGFIASLAIKFFNRAAETGAVAIAFVLPASFRKESVQRKISHLYSLKYDKFEIVEFELPGGGVRSVRCVLQVWMRQEREKVLRDVGEDLLIWCDQDTADIAIRRAGGRAGEVLPIGEPLSESSTHFIKAKSAKVLKLLRTLDFTVGRENTSGVNAVSKTEIVKILRGAL